MRPIEDPAGRRIRFETLFEAHHQSILRYAIRRTSSAADAEDITAETFAVAWRRLEDVPQEARPWLYAVARRLLANHHRGGERRANLLGRIRAVLPSPTAMAPEPHENSGAGIAIAVLGALKEDDQELLRLVAWEELSHREIATMLGITENAVAIRLHRARGRYEAAFRSMDPDGARRLKGTAPTRTSAMVKGRLRALWSGKETT